MTGSAGRMSGIILWIGLAMVTAGTAPARAQDTIALYGDVYGWLSRLMQTSSNPFEIVAVMKAANPSSAAEFVMDDLVVLFPGVFKLSTVKVNNTPLDEGDNSVGEYAMVFDGCVGAGAVEVLRVQYGDFGSVISADVVLSMRGLQPGDSQPSSFGGDMGYVDCVDAKHALAGEPWADFDIYDPTWRPDIDSADGVLVLNPEVAVRKSSIGMLKALY